MTRPLGAHGPAISPIVYGAWQAGGWFWGPSDDDVQIDAMHAAFDAGVNAVDTAPVYGFGHSEEVVGRAIRGRPDVVVLTKCGLSWSGDGGAFFFDTRDGDRKVTIRRHAARDAILAECEQSLRRLGRDTIDVYQLHWPEPDRAPEEVMGAMETLRAQGKIRALGVSNCPPDWLDRAAAVAPLTSIQPKWSWLSRAEEATSLAWARAHGVGAVVYSPLEMGLLTGKIQPDRVYAPGDDRPGQAWFKPEAVVRINAALDTLRPVAEAKGCTLGQLMLAATIAEPGITGALVGARDRAQALQNAAAMAVVVTDAERAQIRATLSAVTPPRRG